ncbi:PREDICTED: uncharacterized protein LOC109230120 [Nicotiana attenuata]|uniref:uncharacterized protein LOC109230120 n=1 Tax=Nicotiana attenuata TaxID=49451 RepID=UPI000904DC5C|nr:PREDICTED: uncharacterized protein LOC109230120 [Nicotiana attenuata]
MAAAKSQSTSVRTSWLPELTEETIPTSTNQQLKFRRSNEERALGTLAADTEKNPKVTIKAVSLRNGKTLLEPIAKPRAEREINSTKIAEEMKIGQSLPKQDISSKEVDKRKFSSAVEESKDMPMLLFPQKMKGEILYKCFGKFLEMLKQLYVNFPFTEVLAQMSAYAKFLKEILSSKRKLEKMEMFKKLEGELRVVKSVPVSLQLDDQTTIIPVGIIEDILMRVDKFVFPVDFILVDMEVNKEVPLILGRPFLCIGRGILDIYEGELMLGVGNKKVVFQMKRMLKYTCDEASTYAYLKLDMVGELAEQHK